MNTRALLLTIALASVGFACHRRTPVATAPPQQDDYKSQQRAVVSALIRGMYLTRGSEPVRLIVIENRDPCPTVDPKVLEFREHIEDGALQRLAGVSADTISDFKTRAKECHPLSRNLDVSVKYVLVGTKEMEQLFPKGDAVGQTFSSKYPDAPGIINVSNPGLNRDYTQAILSTGLWCGSRCGEGYFVLLTNDHGEWNIKTKIETWVS